MDRNKSIKLKIIAYLDGELDEQGMQEIVAWIAKSTGNARYYAGIKDLWETALMDASQIAGTEKEWEKLAGKISHRRTGNHFRFFSMLNRLNMVQMAAMLAAGLLIGWLVSYDRIGDTPAWITASAPKGSVSKIILPDQTEVFLNAGSEIRYAFEGTGSKREVILDGEAWFNVLRNDKNPFLVHTGFYTVKVLGTAFNVKAYRSDNSVTTTLESGTIQVASSDQMKLKEDIILKPGDQLVYGKNRKQIQIRQVDPKFYTSWKDNKLEFIKMGLDELIVLLERKYGVEIEVTDNSILQYHYSGTIKNETILEILEIIQHTLPIRYEINDQIIKISKK